ncbi:PAS domain S-box protein [Marispirochaeta sp.]|uniref:PAS domain S-box protein n=1 Tax=Marispirochaeta sp. TaxID=2038653 RepID=UPI0029C85CC7|nr:PAS domain S-box protein [Marispirochaeta sp.]
MAASANTIILLIEDHPAIARQKKDILIKAGFGVKFAGSFSSALSMLKESQDISLILLDINLSNGCDGISAAEHLTEEYEKPLIFLVSSQGIPKVPKSRDIQSYGYLSTDSPEALFIASIQTALRLFIQEKTEKEHGEDSENYRSIINAMNESVWVISYDGSFIDFNDTAVRQLGYSRENLSTMGPSDIDASMSAERIHYLLEHMADEKTQFFETSHKARSGRVIPVEICSTIVMYRGQQAILSIARDITERKKAEEQISSLLQEKELLLKETHHRIKNNMGVIRSLLSIQSRSAPDISCQDILLDAANRLQGMMVLYDKLYRSRSFTELSIKNFLTSLIKEVIAQYPSAHRIKTEIALEDITLDTKLLSTIGIMISEMLTNSMKYAFPQKTSGTISVQAYRQNNTVSLVYADDGIGLPEDTDLDETSTFGLELIHLLTKQIDGTLSIDCTGGTRYILEIGI